MEKKFRFYDPFNDVYSYSDQYGNLALFFLDYGRAESGENSPILEQWTGLHDSTAWDELPKEKQEEWLSKDFAPSKWAGIEIYEGDIVKYSSSIESGLAEIESMFSTSNLGFRWITQNTTKPSLIDSVHYYGCSSELKIMGNKNQHPELLKQDDKNI